MAGTSLFDRLQFRDSGFFGSFDVLSGHLRPRPARADRLKLAFRAGQLRLDEPSKKSYQLWYSQDSPLAFCHAHNCRDDQGRSRRQADALDTFVGVLDMNHKSMRSWTPDPQVGGSTSAACALPAVQVRVVPRMPRHSKVGPRIRQIRGCWK